MERDFDWPFVPGGAIWGAVAGGLFFPVLALVSWDGAATGDVTGAGLLWVALGMGACFGAMAGLVVGFLTAVLCSGLRGRKRIWWSAATGGLLAMLAAVPLTAPVVSTAQAWPALAVTAAIGAAGMGRIARRSAAESARQTSVVH